MTPARRKERALAMMKVNPNLTIEHIARVNGVQPATVRQWKIGAKAKPSQDKARAAIVAAQKKLTGNSYK